MKNKNTTAKHRISNNFILTALVSLSVAACVTVNVHFPESAVQKETDSYVRDLYQIKPKTQPSPAEKTTSYLDFLGISSALAADPIFHIDSPQAMAIKESMRSRVTEVLEQKRSGQLMEGTDGLLKLSPKASEKPLLRKKLESLVANENRDRESLYREVIGSNGLSEAQLPAVRRSFVRSFQSESPSGTYIQNESGSVSQKP